MLTGLAQAGTTASPSTSASLNPSAAVGGSGASAKPLTAGKPGSTCEVTRTGRITDCQQPVAKGALPAGAKNTSIMGQQVQDLASLVDTRTWTTGGGNTFPGAEVPYGMVQWSPDTLPDRNAGGGYSYTDTTLTGYSLTHVSGPGCAAGGDVPILPVTGALPSGTDPNSVTTAFSHAGEVSQAGYYSAQSNGTDAITSEFTATTHSSMGQFTFPQGSDAGFDIKLQNSQTAVTSDTAQIVGNDEVQGSVTTGDFCAESNNDGQVQQYTVHFDIKFNQPFTSSQVITNSGQTSPAAVYVSFGTSNPVVEAKVGISYVSAANAQLNWQAENTGWNFSAVKAQAQRTWNKLLGKIGVSGGSYSQTQEFYSLLYKDFIQPNVTSDVNGQFTGADNKVHTLASGQRNQYGIYSGWDIYHSLAQLQAMLDPSAASDQAQSQVNYYSEDGLLQQWGYLNLNNYVMVGDPSTAIISDYYAFGARGFDTKQALADMLKQATTTNDVRPGEGLEQKYGYLPEDGTYGCCYAHGVIATMLEDDSADLALSNFAKSLGDHNDAAMLERRANNWENTFNPDNNLLNARYENGTFEQGITPLTQQDNEPDYVEGDAYEYLWDVPNNYKSLFNLLGGDSKVVPELQAYLSQPNGYGMYDQVSNEFGLGEQYALDYAGDPAGTQAAVHNIETTAYLPGPSGLANNDDLGAESSQYIWEMLGLYPENPGSDTLLVNSPGFAHEQISLSNGKTITVNAPNASSEYYVSSLKINGQPDQKLYTTYGDLSKGATLDWTLSPTATDWGSAPQDAPPSYDAGVRPVVGFTSSQEVTIAPGGTATVQIGAQDATGSPQRVRASVSAPSEITASLADGAISVPADGQGSETLTVHANASANQTFYTVPVTLTEGGTTVSTVNVIVHLAGADPQQATPVITQVSPPAGSLQVALSNITDTASTVTAVNWTLGSQSGTQTLDTTIAPQSSATVSVDVGSPTFGTTYPFTVTSVLSNGLQSTTLSGHVTFVPVVQKSLGSSWSLSDVQDGPSVDLGNWGAVASAQAPAGLAGKVWFDWDSTYLYVTANITDSNFSEPATGVNIWQGDSLQVAATSGVPGSSAAASTASTDGHYEYGAALTPQGDQAYRWIAPTGVATGPVTDAAVTITRDDAAGTTLYEMALPWSDLTSAVQPTAGTVFSISALLNDTDNGIREGFLQWGGGIGPSKDVAEFNMAQLMP
jgi:predicted alpha-1,2-mannosidase